MKIKGIKRGKTIEILEDIDIPDGAQVVIEIENSHSNFKEQHQKLKELFAIPVEDREEWIKIGEELQKDRQADFEKQQT
ncbi:hypothetical protein [Scytonema sp. NUACC26]|uniref:hypothetical protein n=1 Tax=Scytonema sp. NUACC26 TaxID=3140176 RepID=UPI0034DC2933